MGRREIVKLLKAIPTAIDGTGEYKAKTLRTRFFAHFASYFFRRQHEAFKTKSEGWADEFGNTWKPISERTKIYRALSASEKRQYGVTNTKGRGLLTAEEDRRWKLYFARSFRQLSLWMGDKEAKSKAAKIAWAKLKEEGAKTKKEMFAGRKATILVRTGRLMKSFEPTSIGGGYYRPSKDQIAEYAGPSITLGTRVPYASHVNKDRPLFPEPSQYGSWVNEGVKIAITEIMKEIVENIE